MLRSVKELIGYRVAAREDEIGKIYDCLFDDERWMVRYFVMDTGGWLTGRRVLISPVAVKKPDWSNKNFPVDLTKDQIENSPEIAEDAPVSKQNELELVKYYGWPTYWNPTLPPDPMATGMAAQEAMQEERRQEDSGDPHLRSAREVRGYNIHAVDGNLGKVSDFLVNDEEWLISYVVIDTHKLLPGGKNVRVAPVRVESIEWAEQSVHIDLTTEQIKNSPEYKQEGPLDRQYEINLYDYFNKKENKSR